MKNRIRDVRKAADTTQEQLAKAIGVTHATLSRYENGTIDPPTSQLQRIADYFDTTTDYLLCRTDDPDELYHIETDPKGPFSINSDDRFPDDEVWIDNVDELKQAEEELTIRDNLDSAYEILNLIGQQKVAGYAMDLAKISEYRRQDAPETSTDASEDTDTPAPPEGSEGPPEGE